jgi:uncharacterized protein involved in tolerance to divalent cations
MVTPPITAAVELVLDCADGQEAERVSSYLLKRRLIASASYLPKDQSSRWITKNIQLDPVTLMLVTRSENVRYISSCVCKLLQRNVPINTMPVELPPIKTLEWVDTVRTLPAIAEGS